MKTSFLAVPALLILVAMLLLFVAPVSAQTLVSGGFFDDGFYADDWFYDYYDVGTREAALAEEEFEAMPLPSELEADQIYEGARESGLFEF